MTPRTAGDNDIYTVLAMVGFLAILVATIYVGFQAQTLFGTLIPPGGS
jgi:hypothetical protein